jgi:hypothetical protein
MKDTAGPCRHRPELRANYAISYGSGPLPCALIEPADQFSLKAEHSRGLRHFVSNPASTVRAVRAMLETHSG